MKMGKRTRLMAIYFLFSASVAITHAWAQQTRDYPTAQVGSLYTSGESACNSSFMFTLVNLRPVETPSGQSWFSISKAHPQYQELVSLVMFAKAAARNINVRTSGVRNVGCDTAEVLYIVVS
jgi:hypothetical protein